MRRATARGAERKRQPHWTEEVATATLMAPLHSSSSRSDRAFFGIGSPCPDHGTERPWADPPQPAISSPVSRAHTPGAAQPALLRRRSKFCVARGSSLVQAASISEPSTLKFFCLSRVGFWVACFRRGLVRAGREISNLTAIQAFCTPKLLATGFPARATGPSRVRTVRT